LNETFIAEEVVVVVILIPLTEGAVALAVTAFGALRSPIRLL